MIEPHRYESLRPLAARLLPWLGLVARLGLGGVLVWAGGSKVTDLAGSVRAVHAYRILPYELSTVVGSTLPFVEVAVGVLLLAGMATRLAAAVSGGLLAIFTAGIAGAWARGLSIDCGCFGGGGQLAAGQRPQFGREIARDAVLLAAAALLVWRARTPWSVDAWLARPDAYPLPDHPSLEPEAGDTGADSASGDTDKEIAR